MANELEHRVKDLEEYRSILYAFIDELRRDHIESNRRIAQNEEMIRQIVEMNGNVLRLIDAMDDKLDNHEDRLSGGGL